MKNLIPSIIMFIVLLFMGCKLYPTGYHPVNGNLESTGETCNKFFTEIKKKWAISNDVHCYYYNKKLVAKVLDNKNCFVGRDTSEITQLFGEPNDVSTYTISYNISKQCRGGDDIFSRLTIDFKYLNNKIVNVKYSGSPPPH